MKQLPAPGMPKSPVSQNLVARTGSLSVSVTLVMLRRRVPWQKRTTRDIVAHSMLEKVWIQSGSSIMKAAFCCLLVSAFAFAQTPNADYCTETTRRVLVE